MKAALFAAGIALLMIPQGSSAETLAECAAIAADPDRVACYDRLAGNAQANGTVSQEAAACEASLVGRLVTPSQYKRIGIKDDRLPMTLSDWVDREFVAIRDRNLATPDTAVKEREKVREGEAKMKAAGTTPTLVRTTITFEAPNLMGGIIRSIEICEVASLP